MTPGEQHASESPHLLAACWTWAGDAGPGHPGPADIEGLLARICAAAAAGWHGLGFHDQDLTTAREGIGYSGLREVLRESEISTVEVEFLGGWWLEEGNRETEQLLLEAASALGARAIKAGVPAKQELRDIGADHVASRLRRLGDRADEAGTTIALEAMGMPGALTITDVIDLLHRADSPSCGAVVDNFQLARAGTPYSALRDLDWGRVASVELGDARGTGDAITERCIPGEGDIDLPGFIRTVRELGWAGPWGVEIISSELRALPQPGGVRLVHDRTCAAFAHGR